jgi:c-di-GMP-related signal transduction protein
VNHSQVLAKIREHDKHREEVALQREQQRQQAAASNDSFEKMMKFKETMESKTKDKCNRTLQQLRHKEDITKQEMERVREAQERRRTIKAIRY